MNILSWLSARGHSREDLARSDDILEGRAPTEPVSPLLSAAKAPATAPLAGEEAALAAFRIYHQPQPHPAAAALPTRAQSTKVVQVAGSRRPLVAKILAGGLAFSLIGGVAYAATSGKLPTSKPKTSVAAQNPTMQATKSSEPTEVALAPTGSSGSTVVATAATRSSKPNASRQAVKNQQLQQIRDDLKKMRACLDLQKRDRFLVPKDSALLEELGTRDVRAATDYCTKLVTRVCAGDPMIPVPGDGVPGLPGWRPSKDRKQPNENASRDATAQDNRILALCRSFTNYSPNPEDLLRLPTLPGEKGKATETKKADRSKN